MKMTVMKGLVGIGGQAKIDAKPFVEKVRNGAKARNRQQAPGRADGDGRDDERQYIDGAEYRAPGKALDQRLRQQKAQNHLDANRGEGEESGAPERIQKRLIEDQAPVVVDASPLHPKLIGESIPVEEADYEHVDEREETDNCQNDKRRRQHAPSQSI
jgi:hypothetical protein